MPIKTIFTTKIELKKNKNLKNYLLAGDWCLKEEKFIKKNNVLSNIWESYTTISKHYRFLQKVHKKINKEVSNYLFTYHNKVITKKIWNNLLFVWLTYYLFFYYFKWKTVEKIFKIHKKLIFISYSNTKSIRYIDSLDFYDKSSNSDILNYLAFKKVILFKKANKLINVKIVNKNQYLNSTEISSNNKQLKGKSLLEYILLFIQKTFLNPRILVIDGVNFKFNFFFNLFEMQFPTTYKNIFDWKTEKKKLNIRAKIKSTEFRTKGTKFEKFIYENIIHDIPLCFTSGFNQLNKIVNKIKFNPKIIISGTQHVHNEIAKLWVLKQKYIFNKKLFIVSHGGGHQNLSLTMYDYEHKIGNYFFQWIDKKKFFNSRLPNTKYSFKNLKRKSNADKIIFVGNELKPYINRISPGPMSIYSSNTINDLEKIFKNLSIKIKPKIYYAPKKKLISYFKNKLLTIINKSKILSISALDENIKNCRLVICSYPQTTFFDSLLSGPTILVYNPKQWRHYKELNRAYKTLKYNKIIFDNPVDAAKHINRVWHKIDLWWNEKEVIKARNLFLKEFNLPPKNNLLDIFRCLKIFKKV